VLEAFTFAADLEDLLFFFQLLSQIDLKSFSRA
jgi:hypothetical protein